MTKKKGFTAFLLALAMVLPMAPAVQTAAAAPTQAPVIFRLSEEVKPGEAFHIYGGYLYDPQDDPYAPGNVKVYATGQGYADAELPVLQVDDEGGSFLAAQLPGSMPGGVYEISVENSCGRGNSLLLNAAQPLWIDSDVAYPGIVIQATGSNLQAGRFGASGQTLVNFVAAGGARYAASVVSVEPYAVKFAAPAGIPVGTGYTIEVSNDGGAHWGLLKDSDQHIEIIDPWAPGNHLGPANDPDPYDLGVAWAAYYKYDYTVNVKDFGATGDGVTDDTAAIEDAMIHLAQQGGGIAYFPNGTYMVQGIWIPAYTILQGESKSGTRIVYTYDNPSHDGGAAFFRTRDGQAYTVSGGAQYGGGAAYRADDKGYQGITNMTLSIADDANPNFACWIGHAQGGWGTRWNTVFKGYFLANVNMDYSKMLRHWFDMTSYAHVEKYYLIKDTDTTGWVGFSAPLSGDYITVKNNTYDIDCTCNEAVGNYIVYENNQIVLDPRHFEGQYASLFAKYAQQGIVARDKAYVAHNTIKNTGAPDLNDGEIVSIESSHGAQLFMTGPVTSATANTVTITPYRKSANDNNIYFIWDVNTNLSTFPGKAWFGKYYVTILKGKGEGQTLKLTGYNDSTRTFTVEGGWAIQPDSTSVAYIGQFGNDVVVYDNYAENCKGSYFSYGPTSNIYFADNKGQDIYGAGVYNMYCWDGPNGNGGHNYFWPTQYAHFFNNEFSGTGKMSDTNSIYAFITYETTNTFTYPYLQYGLMWKGNVQKDAPDPSDPKPGAYTQRMQHGIGINVNSPARLSGWQGPSQHVVKGAIIQNNTFENMYAGVSVGYYVDPLGANATIPNESSRPSMGVTGVVVKDNSYTDVERPHIFNGVEMSDPTDITVLGEYNVGEGVDPYTDNWLAGLSLNDGSVVYSPVFSPSKTRYTATVAYQVASVTIAAPARSAQATVSGAGAHDLSVGDNEIVITVQSASGAAKTYTVNVIRAPKRPLERPTVFKLTDEVKPGDLFYIYGDMLAGESFKIYAQSADMAEPMVLPVAQADPEGQFAAVLLRNDLPAGVYEIWAENELGASGKLLLNAARPQWLQWDVGYAGLEVQIVGNNFMGFRFGAADDTKVRLVSAAAGDYEVAVPGAAADGNPGLEPYSVTFVVPSAPLGVYSVQVSNDGGANWASLESGQTFEITAAGADPLGLGVAWETNYNYANVFDVTSFGAVGDWTDGKGYNDPPNRDTIPSTGTDSTNAINAALAAAKASGGGIVYFPAAAGAYYHYGSIVLPPKTIIKGDDPDTTKLYVDMSNRAGMTGNWPYIFMRSEWSGTATDSGVAVGGYNGLADITLSKPNDLPMPEFVSFIGNGYNFWGEPVRQDGFFVKNVKTNFRDTNGWAFSASMVNLSKYLLVLDSEFTGYSGLFDKAYVSYHTSKNNTYNVDTQPDNSVSCYTVSENNAYNIGGNSYGADWMPSQASILKTNFYSAHNTASNTGKLANADNPSTHFGDIISGDSQYSIPRANFELNRQELTLAAVGGAASVNGTTLTIKPVNNSAGLPVRYNDRQAGSGPANGRPVYGYLLAVIVDGKGMGQSRKVTYTTKNSNTFVLDSPWDVEPDEYSVIYVGNLAHNAVIYGNDASNCKGGFTFADGALDSVIADNTGVSVMGAGARTNYTFAGTKYNCPSFFVSLLNNSFAGPGKISNTLGIYGSVAYDAAWGGQFGVSQFGLIIKGNALSNAPNAPVPSAGEASIAALGIPQGISVKASGDDTGNLSLIKAVLIENNTLSNMNAGVTLGKAVEGVILHNNLLDGGADQRSFTAENGAKNVVYFEESVFADATLKSLELRRNAALVPVVPAFDPDVTEYAATVAASATSVTLTAAPNAENASVAASVAANGGSPVPVSLTGGSGTVSLAEGENVIEIVVTAADGCSTMTYRVVVTRPAGVITCPVKSMLAKVAKLQAIPCDWSGDGTLTFSTSNPAVCGVTADGILIPMKAGISVITITAPDGQKVIFAVTVSV